MRRFGVAADPAAKPGQVWELACLRWHHLGATDKPRCLHRRQASSHRGRRQAEVMVATADLALPLIQRQHSVKCGSWLACDGITSVQLINRGVCIAGKPAPTGVGAKLK